MAYEVRDNSGSLFKNERKDKDTHPDYTGNGMIDGREYWFSAWIKRDRNGKAFMSLSFKPKEEQKPAPKRADPISTGRKDVPFGRVQSPDNDMDDEIPF